MQASSFNGSMQDNMVDQKQNMLQAATSGLLKPKSELVKTEPGDMSAAETLPAVA